jgi:hypothetical protein
LCLHEILYTVPEVQHELSPPYTHSPLTLNLFGQLHGRLPRSASITYQSSLCLRSSNSLSCRFVCRLYMTWGQSHFSQNAFWRLFITILIGRCCFPTFAYFTMNKVLSLSIPCDCFLSLLGPDLDSSSRTPPNFCIFFAFFNWPAIVRASCLSWYMWDILWFSLAVVFVVRSAKRSSMPERGLLLCGFGGGGFCCLST